MILKNIIMPDYSKGKIYKITWENTDKIYIGSTCDLLCNRKAKHIYDYRTNPNKISCHSLFDEFGIDCKFILIENFPCNSKEVLLAREQYWIDKNRNVIVNNKNSKGKDIQKRKRINEYRSKLYKCQCGGKYTYSNTLRHLKSFKHLKWEASLVEITFED